MYTIIEWMKKIDRICLGGHGIYCDLSTSRSSMVKFWAPPGPAPPWRRPHCGRPIALPSTTIRPSAPGPPANRGPGLALVARGKYWWRLRPAARAALANHGITSEKDLAALPVGGPGDVCFSEAAIQPFLNLICVVRSALLDNSQRRLQVLETVWEKEMMRFPSRFKPKNLHEALGAAVHPTSGRRAGPVPSQFITLLHAFVQEGGDAIALADEAVKTRSSLAVQDATLQTYFSHLNMVERACRVFGGALCPARIEEIRQVSMVCHNPNTLKGWLAAWRRLHLQQGLAWAGDGDSVLAATRLGTARSLPTPPAKKRIRRPLLRKLLQAAVKAGELEMGSAFCLSYVFGLRVPSELLRQGFRCQWSWDAKTIRVSGLKRKGKSGCAHAPRIP